jgi:hypothetical protein
MSMDEDYRPCRACGALTDSIVCSEDCADELRRARDDAKHAEREAAGLCPYCGEIPCPTCQHCHDCDDCTDAVIACEATS